MLWKTCVCAVVLLALGFGAASDSIKVNGHAYQDVIVREGNINYYIQIPADGATVSVLKSDVSPGDVVITSDKDARQALLDKWTEQSQLRREREKAKPAAERNPPDAAPAPGREYRPMSRESAIVEKQAVTTDKGVPRLVLKGNRRKEEGFETRVEQQRVEQRAQQERAMEEAGEPTPAPSEPAPSGQAPAQAAQPPQASFGPGYGAPYPSAGPPVLVLPNRIVMTPPVIR